MAAAAATTAAAAAAGTASADSLAAIYAAFHSLRLFARELNTQLATPEIVVIGRQSHGKSALIEAFLGHPLGVVVSGDKGAKGRAKGGCTKRPIFFQLVNNPECAVPRVTIKRDTATGRAQHAVDAVVPLASVESAIAERNVLSPTPLIVTYEFRDTWNMTFIDTPGLLPAGKGGSGEVSAEEIEEMALALCKPAHRLVLCVEEVRDGAMSEMVAVAKKADPKLDRTVFAFNKFADQIKSFTSSRDLNRYLLGAAPDATVFFTTLPSPKERQKYTSAADPFALRDAYFAQLAQMRKDDLDVMEQLQYDRRYRDVVGMGPLRQKLLELTWKKYQDGVPELLKRLRALRRTSVDELAAFQTRLGSLGSANLRGMAARFVMAFLQNVEKLLCGTLEGNPTVNGQTLAEEIESADVGRWMSAGFMPITFGLDEIPHAGSKLYGGQQFERLLAEFQFVANQVQLDVVTPDDVASACGASRLASPQNIAWAASDIAQKQIQRSMLPLVKQLFKRATYILFRLVGIAQFMTSTDRTARGGGGGGGGAAAADRLDQYPFFANAVHEHYYAFVGKLAEECRAKCMDEFFTTKLIYWEASRSGGPASKLGKSSDGMKSVQNLAMELFDGIRERMAKTIVLKVYNFFVVPMTTDLWGEIQGSVTCYSDEQLLEYFEVETTKTKLQDEITDMEHVLAKFGEKEERYAEFSSAFAKWKPAITAVE